MAKRAKTIRMLNYALEVLSQHHPMTVRQVYYQLVAAHIIANKRTEYNAVSRMLVEARQNELIPWEWMEDRTRRAHTVGMWENLSDFAETARQAYRRDVWSTQPRYVECWVENDALSGIFEDVLNPYGVTLNVGRGYDGWDSLHNAAERYTTHDVVSILYFGDFDPSGEDMGRSLVERLEFFGCEPEFVKCALTPSDIERYNLPPDFAKKSDTRHKAFVARHGDVSVELDALPVDALRDRIRQEVEARMDLDALQEVRDLENSDKTKFMAALEAIE